jgi:hypothetical protein
MILLEVHGAQSVTTNISVNVYVNREPGCYRTR